MERTLEIVGLILFLIFAAVSLAVRARLIALPESVTKAKKTARSTLAKIVRTSFLMK